VPKAITDAWVVAKINLLGPWRMLPIYVLLFTLFPLSFLFFARNLTPPGIALSTRLITGSIVFGLGLTIVNDLSQTVLNERFNWQLKLIQVCPVNKASYAVGVIIAGLARGVVNAAIILLFAPLFGIHVHLSLWLVPLILLCALSLSGIAFLVGTWAPSQQLGNVLANSVGILVVMFSPIYYPLSRLPEWLQWPARFSPYTHAGTAIDAVLANRGGFYDEMIVLAAITALTLVAGFWGMRWRES
jgi:ABC-2 type transport system permease protein